MSLNEKKTLSRRDLIVSGSKALGASLILPSAFARAQSAQVGSNEYQFIIVGSGAGGGPVAANLAKKGFSVLLIEAGGANLPLSATIPGLHPFATEDEEISWDFWVKQSSDHYSDQKHSFGYSGKDQRSVLYPRSSVLGGCTSHNAMIFMLPDPRDWKHIYELSERRDRSWHPDKMYSLFKKKIENSHYFNDRQKGWQHITTNPASLLFKDPLAKKIFFSAVKEEGLLETFGDLLTSGHGELSNPDSFLDINAKNAMDDEGIFRLPRTTYLGKRYGVYDYLKETQRAYPNLKIAYNTLVKKVLFEKKQGQLVATGVVCAEGKYLYGAHKKSKPHMTYKEKVYKCSNEVILSAGAFNTPQLLMLSGIGPKDQFSDYGGKSNSPHLLELNGVGRNLKDRYEVSVTSKFDPGKDFNLLKGCELGGTGKSLATDPCVQDWLLREDKKKRSHPYSSNGVIASVKKKSSVSKDRPDMILFGTLGDFRGYFPGYAQKTFPDKRSFTWAILKGYSRNQMGRVTLKSSNFRETPDINFNYFEGPGGEEDLQAVFEGVEQVRRYNQKVGLKTTEYFPGKDKATEQELKQWIKEEAWGHHASCTCKMGLSPKEDAVVDFDFKVHGTKNLRIVDTSVFPEIPGLFIAAPTFMISEKASRVILRDNF